MGTRSSFRPRPIDLSKPLLIIRSSRDIKNEDAVVSRALPEVSTGVEDHEMEERHLKQALLASMHFGEGKRAELEIPVPVFHEVDSVCKTMEKVISQFALSPEYATLPTGKDTENDENVPVEYEADFEDERWLEDWKSNDPDARNFSLDQFEAVMDSLERLQGKEKELKTYEQCMKDTKIQALGSVEQLRAIHDRWFERRNTRGISFLRCFLPPIDPNNMDPTIAFRPRELESVASRERARKNTYENYRKMGVLRRDLDTLLDIITMVEKREQAKQEHYRMTIRAIYKRAVKSLLTPKASVAPVTTVEVEDLAKKKKKPPQEASHGPPSTKPIPLTPQQKLQKAGLDSFFFDEHGQRFLKNMRYFAGAFAAHGVNPYDHRVFSAASERNTVRENPRKPKTINFPDDVGFCRGDDYRPCRARGRVGRGGRIIFDRVLFEPERGVRVASYPASIAIGGCYTAGMPLERFKNSPLLSKAEKALVKPLPPVTLPGSENFNEPYDVATYWPSRKRARALAD